MPSATFRGIRKSGGSIPGWASAWPSWVTSNDQLRQTAPLRGGASSSR
jgi:hypothetical protein